MASASADHAVHHNNDVDYVIRYRFGDAGKISRSSKMVDRHCRRRWKLTITDSSEAGKQLELLLRTLVEIGLQTEVRQGDESTLLVFVRATKKSVKRGVYHSR